MLLKFWGTRGSIPSPIRPDQVESKLVNALEAASQEKVDLSDHQAIKSFVEALTFEGTTIGGNTTCITVELETALIIFDAGSGIRELGEILMDKSNEFAQKFEFYQGKGQAAMFFTHTHWDHIQGLPFFTPLHVPGNKFDIYHVHDYVPDVLTRQMRVETCPVQFDQVEATVTFHQLADGETVEVAGATIANIELNHPGKAYAYRVELDKAVAILATDGEYTDLDYASMRKYRNFYANADALIFDAMFSVRESFIKEDWGHSSALIGADIARESNVKRLFLFHHDPTATDAQIMQVLQATREYLGAANRYPQVLVAREGLEIELGNPLATADFYMDDYLSNNVIFISLSGKFGAQVTEQFKTYLLQNLQKHSANRVVLQMENLSELTMAGIRALVETRKNVMSLALVAVPENIYRVLELSGTTDFFAIYEDDQAALAAINSNAKE
jgi:anti-anti-sigma factor